LQPPPALAAAGAAAEPGGGAAGDGAISPYVDLPVQRGYGGSHSQRLSTTVSGRLGEWIELGGSSQQDDFERSGSLHGAGGQTSERRSIWLQVEELP